MHTSSARGDQPLNRGQDNNLRVFQGVTGQAGQPGALAEGLRSLGVDAVAGTVLPHRFGYEADIDVTFADSSKLESVYAEVACLAEQFDVFHLHSRSFATRWPELSYPSLLDLLLLKGMGKKVFFHFRGQEIRNATLFKQLSPYHYVDDRAGAISFQKISDEKKEEFLSYIRAVADGIFVTDPELQSYVPEAVIVPRALPVSDWDFVGVPNDDIPLVVHAPSRRSFKGTEAIVAAVTTLQQKINFQFQLIEGMTHEQAKEIYSRASIVIDQLRIGWYGVLAVEAMAMGKPTIAYIRDDLWRKYGSEMPIINANPDNIKEVLEYTLLNSDYRKIKARQSREYFLSTHAADVVCNKLIQIYSSNTPKPVNWVMVGKYLDSQREAELQLAKKTLIARAIRYFSKARQHTHFHGISATLRLFKNKLVRRLSRNGK